jgi:ABC-type glycerol-3-phosphate transport system substrate-binding protein
MAHLRRLLLFTIAAVILSLTFGTVTAQEPITLNLWTFLADGVLQATVEAFQAQHPHITIQLTVVPEEEYVTKVDTAILAGTPPDLGFPYTKKWIKAGQLLPINDAMAAAGIHVDDLNYGAITRN